MTIAKTRLLAMSLAVATLLGASSAMAAGQVGQYAANFTLTDSQGNVHTLSDYRGEVVLLFMMGYG